MADIFEAFAELHHFLDKSDADPDDVRITISFGDSLNRYRFLTELKRSWNANRGEMPDFVNRQNWHTEFGIAGIKVRVL